MKTVIWYMAIFYFYSYTYKSYKDLIKRLILKYNYEYIKIISVLLLF